MEWAPVTMNVTHVESLKFVAKTAAGMEILVEPCPNLGGGGTVPNPMEFFIAALGTCAVIKNTD